MDPTLQTAAVQTTPKPRVIISFSLWQEVGLETHLASFAFVWERRQKPPLRSQCPSGFFNSHCAPLVMSLRLSP